MDLNKVNDLLLEKLAEAEGYDNVTEMLAEAVSDSIVPSICTDCNSTYQMEPDQRFGHCDNCGGNNVSSCLVLAGII